MNAGFEIVVRIFQTSSIDKQETVVDASHDVITGRSLFTGDDGDVLVRQTIEEAGLAGVGLADEGDDREFLHGFIVA